MNRALFVQIRAKKNQKLTYASQLTDEETCVRFRAEQVIPIGLIQPAVAVIYDYYSPGQS